MSVRSRLRDYQKLIPRSLQAWARATHINRYVRADVAPDPKAVKRVKQRWSLEDDTWFDHVKSVPENERVRLPPDGLKSIRQQLPLVEGMQRKLTNFVDTMSARDPRQLAIEQNSRFPGRNMTPGDVASILWDARDAAQTILAPKAAELADLVAKADGKRPRQLGNGMRDLFDLWTKTPLARTGRPPEITGKHKASVERFIAVCGNLSVKEITRDHIRQFYAQNDKELPDKPSARIKHRDHIKALLNLAASEGWRDDNPADKIRINVASAQHDDEEGKKALTPAQLTAILGAAHIEWADNPDAILALRVLIYGGFRSNECCQLRASDIENKDGIPCVRVRKGPGQSVKNKPSRRYVPLHKEIAADVLARSGDGHEFLFPSFPHNNPKAHNSWLTAAFNGKRLPRDGTSHQPADGSVKPVYVGLLRGVCGITDPDVTLHSVRRSFKEACRRARVEAETCNELMGHGKGCENEKYSGEMLELMADAIHDVNPLSAALKPRR